MGLWLEAVSAVRCLNNHLLYAEISTYVSFTGQTLQHITGNYLEHQQQGDRWKKFHCTILSTVWKTHQATDPEMTPGLTLSRIINSSLHRLLCWFLYSYFFFVEANIKTISQVGGTTKNVDYDDVSTHWLNVLFYTSSFNGELQSKIVNWMRYMFLCSMCLLLARVQF